MGINEQLILIFFNQVNFRILMFQSTRNIIYFYSLTIKII